VRVAVGVATTTRSISCKLGPRASSGGEDGYVRLHHFGRDYDALGADEERDLADPPPSSHPPDTGQSSASGHRSSPVKLGIRRAMPVAPDDAVAGAGAPDPKAAAVAAAAAAALASSSASSRSSRSKLPSASAAAR